MKVCSQLTLKAIYSRSLKSAKALDVAVDLYSDDSGSGKTYHDLLLRDDIHAVILALPILSQPEYIEAALAAGKHVLSEKPIAANIKRAEQLIQYYKSDKVKNGATWGVAENFRYLESFEFGRKEIQRLGRILGFSMNLFTNVSKGDKYFETAWRKTPEYQGGFLLDGGVHFTAAMRVLLGESAKPTALSAYTSLLQEHLPPVDTVNSIWHTKSGISGTFAMSFGTTLSASDCTVACEKGSITVSGRMGGRRVVVREGEQKQGKFTEKDFPDDGMGVKQEVKAWAESLVAGKTDPGQAPEEALADLEILEKMLRSGEAHGKTESLQYQL